MPLRETRRFKTKTKGFVISFGDLMLPLVGLVAIGLLVAAGKIFFFSDQTNSQPIPMTVAPPDAPRSQNNFNTQRADASESVRPPSLPQTVGTPQDAEQVHSPSEDNLLLDMSREAVPQPNTGSSTVSASPVSSNEEIIVVAIPSSQSAPPPPSRTAQETPVARPQPSRPNPRPAVRPAQPAPPKQTQRTWKVQVGAYSTKSSAESVVQNLARAGHSAAVVSGRLHRVLVQAGATRQEALNLAASLQGGYPGAFVVPPGV